MAIAVTAGLQGNLSASVTFSSINGTDTISNAALSAACTGRLKQVVDASYASVAAFLSAWAAAGGLLSLQSDRPSTTAVFALAANKVIVSVVDTGAGNCALRLALAHSLPR
jgi:hypothetical protein